MTAWASGDKLLATVVFRLSGVGLVTTAGVFTLQG
jgi:hypothetical protein